MIENLISHCSKFMQITEEDKQDLELNFKVLRIKRKGFLLQEGKTCDFIAFVISGVLRHYHLKDGLEITSDICLKNTFITDLKGFTENTPSKCYVQVLKDAELLIIRKMELVELYKKNRNIESLGRIIAEQVAIQSFDTVNLLSSEKPEERVQKMIKERPDLFQEVPQRYLASLIGISPESLSRIRARKKS
jgi:CRP-like cAMP-binding protein